MKILVTNIQASSSDVSGILMAFLEYQKKYFFYFKQYNSVVLSKYITPQEEIIPDYPSEAAVKSQFAFNYPLYMVKNGDIPIDKVAGSNAYFFVLNEDYSINKVFVPQWDMMKLFESYLDAL